MVFVRREEGISQSLTEHYMKITETFWATCGPLSALENRQLLKSRKGMICTPGGAPEDFGGIA